MISLNKQSPLIIASLFAVLVYSGSTFAQNDPDNAEADDIAMEDAQSEIMGDILSGEEENWCIDDRAALTMIRNERGLLVQQVERIEEEESRIDVARTRLEVDVQNLMELKDEVENILAEAEKRHTDDLEKVVSMYSNMRDKQAAAIFEEMDLSSAVEILSAMPERESGPVLSQMDPTKAQAISRVILDRNRLPADRQLPNLN